jgi:diguanylate cyclase (GGDEF)-like protein
MLDIDHFKRINDEHGHDAGDEVLRAVAAVLRNATRDVDVTARHGGEEFVVLLPETGLAAARDAAERVRTAVATATVDPGGRQLSVTVSVGVSAWPDSATAPADLLPGADAALYEAKRSGRNRVVAARPHETAAVPAPSATLRRR